MIGARKLAPSRADPWEDEGRRLAPLFASVASAVVVGRDGESAARVAVGLARAVTSDRRVAIVDLSGTSTCLRTLAGPGDGAGIADGFLQDVPLNDMARPSADGTAGLFILPRGGESALSEEVLRSDRWHRLAAGFAEAGALLLLVARSDAPGLNALVPQTDGAVAVGNAALPLEWRVLAQAFDRAPAPDGTSVPSNAGRSRTGWRIAGGLLVVAALATAVWSWPRIVTSIGLGAGRAAPSRSTAAPAAAPATTPTKAVAPPADTVSVPVPVNPSDSSLAAGFAVVLMATNTVAGANLWIREHGAGLPGVTVSPVLLGSGRVRWHQVVAGAWRDRTGADSMLAALRGTGVLRDGTGLVVRAPVALLLEAGVGRSDAPTRVAALAVRGVLAYALLQDDGTVRLYAGAFDTAASAVLLDADLRAAGFAPQVAYRTGRTF